PTSPPKSTRRSRSTLRRRRHRRPPCSTTCTRSCRRRSRTSARWRSATPMPEVTLVQAVNMALKRAMEDDDSVVILGQDIGIHGGVFRATDGLYQRFGGDRVLDTPLAETAIGGLAFGMAAQGMRPVCEIQFLGFLYPVFDTLVNHAARLRTRTRGRLSCPMTLRVTHGGGVRAPEHHSEAVESMLAHVPGLRVVIPSSPREAYGLLLSAIRDPDPVIF